MDHVRLDPNKSADEPYYFDYSFFELGKYDIPAMINHALMMTGQKKISYLAHS